MADIEWDVSDPEVQEAKSLVYARGIRLVALESGKFAIYYPGAELRLIVDSLREEIIRECCAEQEVEFDKRRVTERSHQPIEIAVSGNAEDMGL